MTKLPKNQVLNDAAREASENSVIGTLVAHMEEQPELVAETLEICPPGLFSYPIPKAIAETLAALTRLGEEHLTTSELLKNLNSSGVLANIERPVFAITELLRNWALITSTQLDWQAERLAQEARKREAGIKLQIRLKEMLTYGGRPVETLAEELSQIARELTEGQGAQQAGLEQQYAVYLDELEAKRGVRPVKSPWRELNGILRGGILPGELGILAARPSVGKSAFALNWAFSVACSGKTALFFSLEMSIQQLLDRLNSNVANVDVGEFREGLSDADEAKVRAVVGKVSGKPLIVNDETRVTLSMMRRRIRAAQKSGLVGLVVVDYLQLVTPEEKSNSREREVAEISRGMKLMAKDLEVPILLLAQLNRKSEEMKREPLLSDLRESGSIEQDADIVMFLHAARQVWHPDEPVRVIVAKGRSSGVGRASLIFRRRNQRFEDSSDVVFQKAQESSIQTWHDREGQPD